jgi:RNA polymerase sigma-70 factor (ECF subfamily)
MPSDSVDDERDERECRQAFDAEDYVRAATLAIERYGREIMAFLLARLRRRSDAEEVFAMFAEKLWIGLASFEWRCSLKTWCYRIARNAANDFATAAYNRTGRHVALSQHEALAQLVDRTRSSTTLYRQTGAREQIRKLRESLSPDDQMLLLLRVDKRMDFRDIAIAMGHGETLEPVEVERDAARLRKRFERVKERLREMAKEAGLI